MDQKPWYEKKKLDTSFPFRLWDGSFQSFSNHWHEFQEIVYIRQGAVSVSIDGTCYEATAGDILVINSGLIHGFFNPTQDIGFTFFHFSLGLFDQSLIDLREKAFQRLIFDRKPFIRKNADGALHKKLEDLLSDMCREYAKQNEGFRLAIKAKLYEFALIFLREIPVKDFLAKDSVRRNYNRQIMERVFTFIHSNYDDFDITLEKAASTAALSRFYFSRFFKAQTGQTFSAYLARVRVSRAEKYLVDSNLPITEVAHICGFGSIKTFNRIFKSFTGSSPSGYRSGKTRK